MAERRSKLAFHIPIYLNCSTLN